MPKPVNSQKRWCNSQTEQTCHQSEKDGTILKQWQKLTPVRKRWHNTQTVPKPDNRKRWCNSQTEQNCHQSEKDGTKLKQCQNLSTVRKRWYNTQTEP